MRVCLMADVPDNLVVRGVEQIMQGNSEFGGAKIRRQMSAIFRHHFQDALPHLGSELGQLRPCETLEICRDCQWYPAMLT